MLPVLSSVALIIVKSPAKGCPAAAILAAARPRVVLGMLQFSRAGFKPRRRLGRHGGPDRPRGRHAGRRPLPARPARALPQSAPAPGGRRAGQAGGGPAAL